MLATAGALIGLERHNEYMRALAREIASGAIHAFAPAGVIAQVWRGSPRQHHLDRLLASRGLRVDPMDETTAKAVGVILGQSEGSDVVNAHVVLLARRSRGRVFTSDPDDLRRIDPHLDVVPVRAFTGVDPWQAEILTCVRMTFRTHRGFRPGWRQPV